MGLKKDVDKNFFKKWSVGMAYILGFLYADGNIVVTERGSYYFSFYSLDEELLKQIRVCLKSNHKISQRNARSGHVYRLQIGSKEMVLDLVSLGLDTQKAKRMKFPSVPKKYLGDFIRGYFDGDGNVWVGNVHVNRKKSSLSILSVFTSASKSFLVYLYENLKSLGIEGGSLYTHKVKNCSRLSFSKNDSLKLYKIMYNRGVSDSMYLPRKKRAFDEFIRNMRS